MRIVTMVVVLGALLNATVMAQSTLPRRGKELLSQLVRQTPWDMTRLRHIFQLELDGAVDAADYVHDAFKLFQQLVVEIPRQEQVQKLLGWELTTPRGARHQLLGTRHDLTLRDFSLPARHTLHTLLTQVDMLVHEGNIPHHSSAPLASYQQLDHQLIARARQLGKATAPLDSALEQRQASLDQHFILAAQEAQLDELRDAEIEALFIEQLGAQERQLRLARAYLHAQHAEVTALARQQRTEGAEVFEDKLLNTRNHRWITRIVDACAQQTSCLITAGYLHLVVDNDQTTSIITLLRERGYRVEAQPR